MQCVVLAGGLGTRMLPATESVPKVLLPVAGEPFASWQLGRLRAGGVTEVVYCIGHLGDLVRDHVGGGERFGLRVTYVDEGDRRLGTAGAIRLAADEGALAPEFLVMYGDSYLPIDLRPVHAAFTAAPEPALMTVFHNAGRWVPSNVVFDGQRVVHYDKHQATRDMEWVDYGVSVLTPALLDAVRSGATADLADLFHDLSRRGDLAGLEVTERFYEIGSPEGRREVEALLMNPVGTR
jgi:NDP-sugar pyrophosphorylase family protein